MSTETPDMFLSYLGAKFSIVTPMCHKGLVFLIWGNFKSDIVRLWGIRCEEEPAWLAALCQQRINLWFYVNQLFSRGFLPPSSRGKNRVLCCSRTALLCYQKENSEWHKENAFLIARLPKLGHHTAGLCWLRDQFLWAIDRLDQEFRPTLTQIHNTFFYQRYFFVRHILFYS